MLWAKRFLVWGWAFESHLSRRKMSFTSKWALLGLRKHFGKDSSTARSTLHTINAHSAITHPLCMRLRMSLREWIIPQVIHTRYNSLCEIFELVRLRGFSVVNKFITLHVVAQIFQLEKILNSWHAGNWFGSAIRVPWVALNDLSGELNSKNTI